MTPDAWDARTGGGTATRSQQSQEVAMLDYIDEAFGQRGRSLLELGGVGDGTVDNTSKILNAIGNGPIFVPSRDKLGNPLAFVTQPIPTPPGAVVLGVNSQSYYNATPTIANAKLQSRLILKAGSTAPMFSPDDTGTNKATGVVIQNICLDCNNIAQPAVSLPDTGTSISRFWRNENIYIVNPGAGSGYAYYVGNQNTAHKAERVIIFGGTSGAQGGYDGFGWYGSDGTMIDCWSGYMAHANLVLLGGAADETFLMIGGGLFTGQTGVIGGGSGGTLIGVSIDHNFNDGEFLGQGVHTRIACTYHTNSRAANNTYSNIVLGAAGCRLTALGCRWATRGGETTNNAKYMFNVTAAGAQLDEFGCRLHAGVTMGTGWTNFGASIPTWSGQVGDVVRNPTPTPGGYIAYVCTGGTTWKGYGVIAT